MQLCKVGHPGVQPDWPGVDWTSLYEPVTRAVPAGRGVPVTLSLAANLNYVPSKVMVHIMDWGIKQ